MSTELAAEGAANHVLTSTEYITHHLGHFQSSHQHGIIDFHVLNYDTIIWSVAMGIVGLLLMWSAARRVTSGVPGRFQAFVEILVELVEDQSKAIVHGNRAFIAPLALTVFVWVFLMNSMDFLPVDMFATILGWFGHGEMHFRVVPTADLNGTLGMSMAVLSLMLFYNVKIKGLGGFVHELLCAPFGTSKNPIWAVLLGVCNLGLNILEFISKPISLAMRLFGNMYAGELLFLLIALLGATATTWGFGLQVILGTVWILFHILIVVLQAFIFMMLTMVYIGQAHEGH